MSLAVVTKAGGARPRTRDDLLLRVSEQKAKVYRMVRTILDDLEAVAPWEGLYYPPTDTQEFLSMETALVSMIEDIPQRVETLADALMGLAEDDPGRELVENLEFYFQGIRVSVSAELEKLKNQLEGFKAAGASVPMTFEQRTFTCEISADLKGKYASSIMGAAASLIAEGLWSGIEIEPILFPEKAEEFDRNEKLVEALSVVTESIATFLEQVPLVDVVASWNEQHRIDQYALSPLYLLLGNLGKLMQVSSRRALYSGDYHQIRQRESQLNTRINELNMLHNMTWGTVTESARADPGEIYRAMIAKATELAAILDVEILKSLIGASAVKDLHVVVTLEKEDKSESRGDEVRRKARRDRVPESLHTLIPVLYDEDLKTFLELLLGSVLKRASLAVKRESVLSVPVTEAQPREEEPQPELRPLPASPGLDSSTSDSPALDSPALDSPSLGPAAVDLNSVALDPPELLGSIAEDMFLDAPALEGPYLEIPSLEAPSLEEAFFEPPTFAEPDLETSFASDGFAAPTVPETATPSDGQLESDLEANRLEALEELLEVLKPLLSRSSSQRKSFELVRRLLKQQRSIPAGLLQSMRPYLFEIMNQLVPKLREDVRLADMHTDYGESLVDYCQNLCDPFLSPEAPGVDLPGAMESVLDLLNHLAIATRSSIERLRGTATGVTPRLL